MKETIAGIIFILVWVGILVLWGNSKDIKPDMSNFERNTNEPCKTQGHPLWTDC